MRSQRNLAVDVVADSEAGTFEAQQSSIPARSTSDVKVSAIDTADYIADLTRELARMARHSRLDLLASILEIARLEAHTSAKRLNTQPGPG